MAVINCLLKISCDKWLVIFGVLVAAILRGATMLHPYSGRAAPPMYGDYEAQRHWMEITTNLPIREWYTNTTNNNLQYWGLDYPPLTAYHMYVCGTVAKHLNPDYTELHRSRGHESDSHKWFMRLTVFFSDIAIYIPSLLYYYHVNQNLNTEPKVKLTYSLSVILALLYPGVVLIDHGHFQYNCVSLGFFVLAVTLLLGNRNVLASIIFCLALNYKQMELYHSLPFFLYLLSTCVPRPGQSTMTAFIRLAELGLAVIVTFLVLWLPFLTDLETATQVLRRQFPFSRGIFEDKVANFWCSLNVFYKLRNFDNYHLMRICLLTTISAIFASSVDLFLRPNKRKFVLSLINSSLAFYLFSYQVHEKTILVVAVPVMLYIPHEPIASFWFLSISTFSMVPLFAKDGLMLAYVSLVIFYSVSFYVTMRHHLRIGSNAPLVRSVLGIKYKMCRCAGDYISATMFEMSKDRTIFYKVIFYSLMIVSLIVSCILTIFLVVLDPPERYPHLFPLLIALFSCVHFLGFFVYFNVRQLQLPQEYYEFKSFKTKGE